MIHGFERVFPSLISRSASPIGNPPTNRYPIRFALASVCVCLDPHLVGLHPLVPAVARLPGPQHGRARPSPHCMLAKRTPNDH